MKPTILFLEQQSWRAGAQRVLDSVLDALSDNFNLLVAFPDDGPYAQDLRGRGVETVQYPLGRYRAGNKSIFEKVSFAARSACCAVRIARLATARKASLIYINAPRALPAGALAARAARIPAIFHLHRTLTNKADLWVATKAAAHVARIVACSRASAMVFSEASPQLSRKILVVYNPASARNTRVPSLPLHREPHSPGRRVIGLVGRITPQKGHLTLLQAVARLNEELPDVEIVFVGAPEDGAPGDAAYLGQLQSAVCDLGLESKVRFVGYQADPGPYYRQFDVLAVPFQEGEGLPMAILEAASWGIPSVASHVGGISEVISDGQTGLLVDPRDLDGWVAAIGNVLRNSDLRCRLGDAAKHVVAQRFSPESFRESIQGIAAEASGYVDGITPQLKYSEPGESVKTTKA